MFRTQTRSCRARSDRDRARHVRKRRGGVDRARVIEQPRVPSAEFPSQRATSFPPPIIYGSRQGKALLNMRSRSRSYSCTKAYFKASAFISSFSSLCSPKLFQPFSPDIASQNRTDGFRVQCPRQLITTNVHVIHRRPASVSLSLCFVVVRLRRLSVSLITQTDTCSKALANLKSYRKLRPYPEM